MAGIAKAAGVSAPTVFAAFTSKANLLKEAAESTLVGDAEPVPLAERPQMRRVYGAASAVEVVERLGEFAADAGPRVHPIYSVVFAAADADPQIAALARTFDEQRLVGAGLLADAVCRHLPDGPAHRDELRDVIWSVTSLHLYGQLVVQRGWPVDRYGGWIARVLTASLPAH
jgi:AcrR family transcriptional regulator